MLTFQKLHFLRRIQKFHFPELKLHPYFNGTDWNEVAQKTSLAPYEAKETLVEEKALDLVALLKIGVNDDFDEELNARFQSKLNFN